MSSARVQTPSRARARSTSPNSSTGFRLSPRRQFLAFLLATALLGTTLSVVSVNPATTAFRSRLPSHTLTQLTSHRGPGAFPVPTLPYFADKRNALNQVFVKRSWGWVTALFLAFAAAVLLFPPSATAAAESSRAGSSVAPDSPAANTRRATASRGSTASGAAGKAPPPPRAASNPLAPHLVAQTRRFLLASLYWFYLTQRTWFGTRLGPSITHRILRSSGAVCVPSAIAHDPLQGAGAGSKAMHLDGPADFETGLACTGARGEYWRGGHDVSGHAFMMVHCALFLFELVLPLLPTLFPLAFAGPRMKVPLPVRVVAYAATAVIALAWWMLLMTNLFFHSPTEKLSGCAFGVAGWLLSSL